MHQHVVPRLIFRRLGFRYMLIPFLCAEKNRIDIDDDASIVEQTVMHELPDGEFRLRGH